MQTLERPATGAKNVLVRRRKSTRRKAVLAFSLVAGLYLLTRLDAGWGLVSIGFLGIAAGAVFGRAVARVAGIVPAAAWMGALALLSFSFIRAGLSHGPLVAADLHKTVYVVVVFVACHLGFVVLRLRSV